MSRQLELKAPTLLPETLVRGGEAAYRQPTPLLDLVKATRFLAGMVAGLDHRGVEWLRWLAGQNSIERADIFIALYPACPTWDHVLADALDLQQSSNGAFHFRVLARRTGSERPANLLWLRSSATDPGSVLTGNGSNFLLRSTWDDTDANLVLPISTESAEVLRRWCDWTQVRSRKLTDETALAPQLVTPEGTEEGRQLWAAYLDRLDRDATAPDQSVVSVDPNTGEITAKTASGETIETLSSAGVIRPVDKVFLAVQASLGRGSLVTLDRVGRAPPLNAPMGAELFGEQGETHAGAIKRSQSFSISLFDEKTQKALDARRRGAADRLSRFSLMLREGQRWMPAPAFTLFEAELEAAAKAAKDALAAAIGGKTAGDFVQAARAKIEADYHSMLKQVGNGRSFDANAVERIVSSLTDRLRQNLEGGMRTAVSRTSVQIAAEENEQESPWGTIQTFLISAARMPREAISDGFFFRGLAVEQEAFLRAFDLFDDALVASHLAGNRVDVRPQLAMIATIEADANSTSWNRSHALFRLIKGEPEARVMAALTEVRGAP
jgi:hypothetical protein